MFLKRGVEKRMKKLHTCRNSLVPVTSCSLTARQPTKQDDKMSRTNYTRKLSRSTNENASQCTVRTCRICSTRFLSVPLSSAFSRVFSVHTELKFFLDCMKNFREQFLLLLEAVGQQ